MWSGLSCFPFPHITFYHFHVSSRSFYSCIVCFPYWPTLHAKYLLHHCHSYHITLMLLLPCHDHSSSSSKVICFLGIKVHHNYLDSSLTSKDLCHFCDGVPWFGMTSNLSLWRSQEMKVEWTLLTAPICKFRCGAWVISHIYPQSALFGHRHSGSQITVSLSVLFFYVNADRATSLLNPCRPICISMAQSWAAMSGYSHCRGLQ
jgi:hypothetical protein